VSAGETEGVLYVIGKKGGGGGGGRVSSGKKGKWKRRVDGTDLKIGKPYMQFNCVAALAKGSLKVVGKREAERGGKGPREK